MLAIALACVLPAVSFAEDEEVEVQVELVPELLSAEADMPEEHVEILSVKSASSARKAQVEKGLTATKLAAANTSTSYRSQLKAALYDAWKKKDTYGQTITIDMSDWSSKPKPDAEFVETLKELRSEILFEHPEIFWTSTAESWSFSYSGRSSVTKLKFPGCSLTASQVSDMQSKCNKAISQIKSWVSKSGATSDDEKCKVVHDWLVRKCLYNKTALVKGGPMSYGNFNPWTSYGALAYANDADKSYTGPVCQGYTLAFNWALDELGISSDCVLETASNGMQHMWSRVKIDDNWYNVDATHDDPLIAGTYRDRGSGSTPNSTYFLKSDPWFKANPSKSGTISYHVSFSGTSTGKDTTYDKKSWKAYNASGAVAASKTSISGAKVTVKSQYYKGKALTPAPTVVLGGKTLTKGTHYTVSYAKNTNAGTATVTITGKGSYTGTVKGSFKIVALSIANAKVSNIVAKNYSGTAITQKPIVKLGRTTLTNGKHYKVTYAKNKAAGTATITITGIGNYRGSVSKKFTISKVNIATNAKAVISGVAAKTYTGKAIALPIAVKLNGKALKKGTDYVVSYKNNRKAGIATVTVAGKGSCIGSVTKKFKIVAFNMKNAKVSGITAKKYTGKAITQKIVVKAGSATLKQGTDYVLTYKNNKKVGTAIMVITGKGSCAGKIVKSFAIKK